MKRLIVVLALLLLLPATAASAQRRQQQWGKRLVPGDSIRVTTTHPSSVMVYGRFAQWSDSTLGMADTTLLRGSVLGFEVWKKRDAGRTFAESFALGVASGFLSYYLTTKGDVEFAVLSGAAVTVLGYALTMHLRPGKWTGR